MMYVFDMEFDSLNPSKIHVLSYGYEKDGEWNIKSTNDYEIMRRFFKQEGVWFIGHNIVQFDIPAAQRILEVEMSPKSKAVDTLGLAWYLYPERNTYSLAAFGEEYGLTKVSIEDWENLNYFEYKKRCEMDVQININLWVRQIADLIEIYEDFDKSIPTIDRITFKLECLKLQADSRWKLDVEFVKNSIEELSLIKEEKIKELKQIMPKVPKEATMKYPNTMYKKDGHLTRFGYDYLKLKYNGNIPESELLAHTSKCKDDDSGGIKYIACYKEPNPNSPSQIKNWLFKLGWKPCTYRYEKKNGQKRAIPMILNDDKELTESVRKLAAKEPQVILLEGIGSISNRLATLEGLLKNASEDGYVVASAAGFTTTLRLMHSVIVNLTKKDKPYGSYIRRALISPEGCELVEADVKSLENTTRNHFIFHLDRAYVEKMKEEDYDSHTELAVLAGLMSKEEEEFYKWYKKNKK